MSRRRPILGTLVPLALVLTACEPGGPPTRPADGTVRVTLDEFSVTPQSIDTRRGPLVLEVRNAGRLPHDLVVRRGETDLARLPTIRPGTAGVVRVRLRRRGEYTLACSLSNHEELGQHGTIHVR